MALFLELGTDHFHLAILAPLPPRRLGGRGRDCHGQVPFWALYSVGCAEVWLYSTEIWRQVPWSCHALWVAALGAKRWCWQTQPHQCCHGSALLGSLQGRPLMETPQFRSVRRWVLWVAGGWHFSFCMEAFLLGLGWCGGVGVALVPPAAAGCWVCRLLVLGFPLGCVWGCCVLLVLACLLACLLAFLPFGSLASMTALQKTRPAL